MSRPVSDAPSHSSPTYSTADERLKFTVLEQAKAIAALTEANARLTATNALQAKRIEKKSRKARKLSEELRQMTAALEQLQTVLDAQRVQPDILISPVSSRDKTPLDLNDETPLPQLRSDTSPRRRPSSREGAPSFFKSRLDEARRVLPRPAGVALPVRSQSHLDTPRPFGLLGRPSDGRDTPQFRQLHPAPGESSSELLSRR